jgi:CRISPR-associated protein Cas5h
MQKLISIDLFADFGMLKKPDTNEPVYLTFNMLHKPALLGALGAIIGESGFKEKGVLPDYYKKLENLKTGIEPLNHENGNFQKTTIKYNNTTGFANKGEKKSGETLNIEEQTLIAPAYRCYFLLDIEDQTHKKIDEHLSAYKAEYLPYLGKNEFSVWWKNYKEYNCLSDFNFTDKYRIKSIFYKNEAVTNHIAKYISRSMIKDLKERFVYFERLPVFYQEIAKKQFQYNYMDFVFTNALFETSLNLDNLLLVNKEFVIQVF